MFSSNDVGKKKKQEVTVSQMKEIQPIGSENLPK
jgi:hypothetical protein